LRLRKEKKQLGIGDDQELSEGISEISVGDTSNKKPRIDEKENTTPMDIDQSETSTSKVQESSPSVPTETSFKLPTDSELEKVSEGELISLRERINKELERREKVAKESQESNVINYSVSTEELKNTLSKAESRIEGFNTPNNSNVGGIVAVVGVISAFAIGGIALVKSKLGKNKKNKKK